MKRRREIAMYKANLLIFTVILSLLVISGCSTPKKISIDEAYTSIAPAEPLPEYLRQEQDRNLIIQIDNVADEGKSYKNYVELYINGFYIKPAQEITNLTRNYHYELLLQPGIYKIEAKYYASSGWAIEKFKILTREKVMIFPDKKTYLSIQLRKNSWGGLEENPSYFHIRYEK